MTYDWTREIELAYLAGVSAGYWNVLSHGESDYPAHEPTATERLDARRFAECVMVDIERVALDAEKLRSGRRGLA
jgi:hypothetical protein